MFHFATCGSPACAGGTGVNLPPGFPIRKSRDRNLLSGSPWHIAARSVLRRLWEPRHPPCTLSSLSAFTAIPRSRDRGHGYQSHPISAGLPFCPEAATRVATPDLPVCQRSRPRPEGCALRAYLQDKAGGYRNVRPPFDQCFKDDAATGCASRRMALSLVPVLHFPTSMDGRVIAGEFYTPSGDDYRRGSPPVNIFVGSLGSRRRRRTSAATGASPAPSASRPPDACPATASAGSPPGPRDRSSSR